MENSEFERIIHEELPALLGPDWLIANVMDWLMGKLEGIPKKKHRCFLELFVLELHTVFTCEAIYTMKDITMARLKRRSNNA